MLPDAGRAPDGAQSAQRRLRLDCGAAGGWPGYNAQWPKSAASVGRVLQGNGYSTAAFGKWHLTPPGDFGPAGPFERWPSGVGFDYFWGFLGAETDQYSPLIFENNRVVGTPTELHFQLNVALADRALSWLRNQVSTAPEKPFFIYYATGSSHAPHQVAPEWIAKYKGRFDAGWDDLRVQTFERQKRLGVIPPDTVLTPRHPAFPAWDPLPPDLKKLYARQMEVYAAYQEETDHEIGRVVKEIERLGQRTTRSSSTSSATTVRAWRAPRPDPSTRWRSSTASH